MRIDDIDRLIEECTYPATAEEFAAAHGARTLDLQEGSETVGDVLARCGSERFDSAEDARLSLYSALSEGAIGRKGYTDRDPMMAGEFDPVSF